MKKKILIFISHYIPGNKMGGPVQSIKNLVYYLKDEFDISIYTSNRDFGEKEPYQNIEFDKWIEFEGVKVYYSSKITFGEIKKILSCDFDWIYLNSFFSFKFSILPILIKKYFIKTKSQILLAPRGEFNSGALNLKKTKKKIYIKFSKILNIYKNIRWHATAMTEKNEIKNIMKPQKKYQVSNLKIIEEISKEKYKEENKLELIHISRIHPKKNIIFFLKILKNIKIDKNQRLKLDIYGPIEDKIYWEKCLEIINYINKKETINVEYKGNIENNFVSKTISSYDFSIFPTLGENFGHVIIESLIGKTPVIVSDKTPWINLKKRQIGYDLKLENNECWEELILNLIKLNTDEYKIFPKQIKLFLDQEINMKEEVKKMKKIFR